MITLIRTEFLKLRTTPAMFITVAATLALTLTSAITTILLAGQNGAPAVGTRANVSKVLTQPASVTCMALFVLGVLIVGGEFRQRTILGTYLAEPRRTRVLVGKILTLTGLGAVLGALTFGINLAVANAIYAAKGIHHLSTPVTSVWLGTILGGACFGLIGVAVGALTRNSLTGVIGGIVWIQIIEGAILQNAAPSLARWLPTGAAFALTYPGGSGDQLSAGVAGVVLVGWGAAIAYAATMISSRREVR
jgi:ABC-2 type transport system permease protein